MGNSPSSCVDGSIATVAGRNCSMQCGIDYPGGDYKAITTSDYGGCLTACAQDPNCSDASFNTQNNYCYLKSSITTPRAVTNVNAAVCTAQGSSVTITTSTTQTVTATTTAAAQTVNTTASAKTVTTTAPAQTVTTTAAAQTVTATAPTQTVTTTAIAQTVTATTTAPAKTVTTTAAAQTVTASGQTVTVSTTAPATTVTVTSVSTTTSRTTGISITTTTTVQYSYVTTTVTSVSTVSTCVVSSSSTFTTSTTAVASSTPGPCGLPSRTNTGFTNGGFENGFSDWTFGSVHGTLSESVIASYAIEGCHYLQVQPSGATANDNGTITAPVQLTTASTNLVFSYGTYANQTLPSDCQLQVFLGGFSLGIFPVCVGSNCGIQYAGVNWATLTIALPAFPEGSNFSIPMQVDSLWSSNDAGDSVILFDDFHVITSSN